MLRATKLYSAYKHVGLTAVRYPRGAGTGAVEKTQMTEIEYAKGVTVHKGGNVAILSFGTLLPAAVEAAKNIGATVVNMRFVKPLDQQLISDLARDHNLLVTLEENVVAGGAGSAVNEYLSAAGIATPTLNLGLPDRYIDHGSQTALLAECGLDAAGIELSIIGSPFYQPAANAQNL
jgi:1-deoxy-D-xylulose-5-phosphate synthase